MVKRRNLKNLRHSEPRLCRESKDLLPIDPPKRPYHGTTLRPYRRGDHSAWRFRDTAVSKRKNAEDPSTRAFGAAQDDACFRVVGRNGTNRAAQVGNDYRPT